jgi:quinol monooxygenase YgiN
VLTDANKPDKVFLYELYANKAAFDTHLASQHFQTFDTAVTAMIADKDVQTWDTIAQ